MAKKFSCKIQGVKGPLANKARCEKCKVAFPNEHEKCIEIFNEAKAKVTTKSGKARIAGAWGYAIGSKTDQFCNLISQAPMTMKAIADTADEKNGGTLGPHPKALKRLMAENLAERGIGNLIYMRVWPKGHIEAGKLTPACIAYRQLEAAQKAASKAA